MKWSAFYEELGEFVAELRRENGWTQENLASQLGIGRSTLSEIEAGNRQTPAHVVLQLASILEVDPGSIILRKRRPKDGQHEEVSDDRFDSVWEDLRKQVRRYGTYYRSSVQFSEPVVGEIIVRLGGWARFCEAFGTQQEPPLKRAFRAFYGKYVRYGILPAAES